MALNNHFLDVGLELRVRVQEGDPSIQSIQNHGWIDIETIGEQRNFGDTFLVCATSTPDNGTIDWYFPNGTGVSDDGEITGPDIYMNRTATLAHLSRRRNATTPVGIYRCEISGSNGGTTFLYAGIYTSTGGS